MILMLLVRHLQENTLMECMSKLFIGIDPGKDSFICLIHDDLISFNRIPMIGDEIDLRGLNFIFSGLHVNCHAVIEDVHSVFGSSAKSNFEFGRTVGILEMVLVCNNIPYTKIQPKKWQKDLWEGITVQTNADGKNDTKATSLLAAQRIFPLVDLRKSERAKKPDHNKVDSLLLAEYCRRHFNG